MFALLAAIAALVLPAGAPSPSFPVPAASTIQAVVNQAEAAGGGTVLVPAGERAEWVKFPSRGKAPVWIVCPAGPAATVITGPPTAPAVIQGLGVSNKAVVGCGIRGSRNGVQFSQSGEDFGATVSNILVQGNVISGAAEDGIKISQGDNVTVRGNVISAIGQQCVDYLDVAIGLVELNDCSGAGVAAGLSFKEGTSRIVVRANKVHDIYGKTVSGIAAGGYGGTAYTRWAHRGYNVTGIQIGGGAKDGNTIWNVQGALIAYTGAQSSNSANNHLDVTGSLQPGAIVIQPDDDGRLSKGILNHFDQVTPATRRYVQLEKRQDAARDGLNAKP